MQRYYSPQLDRDLVSILYYEARARRVPMTKLASELIREGLRVSEGKRIVPTGRGHAIPQCYLI